MLMNKVNCWPFYEANHFLPAGPTKIFAVNLLFLYRYKQMKFSGLMRPFEPKQKQRGRTETVPRFWTNVVLCLEKLAVNCLLILNRTPSMMLLFWFVPGLPTQNSGPEAFGDGTPQRQANIILPHHPVI